MKKLLTLAIGSALAIGVGTALAQNSNAMGEEKVAKPAGKPAISAEQRVMLDEKLRLINRIVQAAGADRVGGDMTVERQRWLLESLYQMPLAQIRAMQPTGSVDGVVREMTKAKAVTPKLEEAAFGGLTSELTYIPVTPCRLIDTRNVGGPIVGSRQFDLDASGSTYGGSASCDVVANSGIGTSGNGAAVAINVAIVSPTAAPGFIGARPVGTTNNTALVNWYVAGPTVQASNAGVVSYDQDSLVANEIEFFGSPTQIIVDLFGVFAAPTATALECSNQLANYTILNNGGTTTQFFAHTACPAGYAKTGASCRQNAAVAVYLMETGPNGCTYRNLGTTDVNGGSTTYCCRVPGR